MKILKLNESANDLYKGIFWIIDLNDVYSNKKYCFQLPTDCFGNNINNIEVNAKSGKTFNHEKTWNMLPNKLTYGKPFNYFPRGRVEISNEKAIIYLNPHINTEDIKQFLRDEYHLYSWNGIKSIRMISDGSEHYKCYLDEQE